MHMALTQAFHIDPSINPQKRAGQTLLLSLFHKWIWAVQGVELGFEL